jgi:uncharacterized protein
VSHERDHVDPFTGRVDFPYWDGLARGELRIQRCEQCRAWRWPAEWRCPGCGSYELGWEQVEPTGIVYSWVRTHMPFVATYADLVPYVNVLVELQQAGGARLMGLLTGDEDGIRIGAPVTGTFQSASPRTLDLAVLTWSLNGAA